ncbi:hypothetical protein [Nannocystis pusilla]|uniref:hypothetical protein n=1 Tax=Nannocystis pusilla TaxID=889268 RepID=UPI003B7E61D7
MSVHIFEIRLGPFGRKVLLVPRNALRCLSSTTLGPVEIQTGPGGQAVTLTGQTVKDLSQADARDLAEEALSNGVESSRIRALLDQARMPWFGPVHLESVADFLLQNFVLVEPPDERGRWLGEGLRAPRERRDEPGLLTKAPREYSVVLRVRVVLDDGAPLEDASVTLTAPDGQRGEFTTSGRGEAGIEGVASDGVGEAVVRPGKVPRWRGGSDATAGAELVFDFSFDAPIRAEVATGATRTIVLRRPVVERVEGASLGFALDSSLLVPLADDRSPSFALATALARLQQAPTMRLLIVGHASPEGSAGDNDALALRRAASARHLLLDERDAWVDLAAKHGSPADVQRLLRYFARVHDWPTEPGRIDGTVDAGVEAAVTSFQSTYNAVFDASILVDGVVGVETLGALFDLQRHELHLQLTALGLGDEPPRWWGARGTASLGARVQVHPGIPESQSAAGQRRIDLLLLDDLLTWRDAHGLDRLYDAARLVPVPLSPFVKGRCDIVLQLVDHYARILADEPYRLITEEEEREGTSDAEGMVVERGLLGKSVRLECRQAVIVVDDPYHQSAQRRYEFDAPDPEGGDDDDDEEDPWEDPDEPLPAADDDPDDDVDEDDDDLDQEDE